MFQVSIPNKKKKLQEKTLQVETAENLWHGPHGPTPAVGQSCSTPPRTKLLVQPWVIQVWWKRIILDVVDIVDIAGIL